MRTLQTQLEEVREKEATTRQQMEALQERERMQVEVKDQSDKNLQAQLEEANEREATTRQQIKALEERCRTLEGSLTELKEEYEKQLEQVRSNERLEKESLKDTYEEKLSSLQRETSSNQESELDKVVSMQEETRQKLREAEEQNAQLLADLTCLREDLAEKSAQVEQSRADIASLEERLQSAEKLEGAVEVDHCRAEHTRGNTSKKVENYSHREDEAGGEALSSLESKLAEAKSEKQKLQKDFTRLQKDLRTLRKEHEQELDYLKKELIEENEKKLKLEVEDLEAKQNSALKQLMREFNTQMALREKELDTAVKETIGKAQSVEAELMDSHREEICQLQKVVSQKEDDLHRTVKRYEEVLQSREEEMGDRVWQVQKELENLQTRTQGDSQMGVEELQAQLAQKTTLLSEAKLKEQGLVDRIHSLEDKMRCVHKNSVVTHLSGSYKEPGLHNSDAFSEPTEFEYLRKVLFEYMMGRETKTMAKVITSILKFSPDQAQTVLDKEDSKTAPWLR